MADNRNLEQRSRNMAAIHSVSTRPELVLRHSLWHRGFRFHINVKRLPGSPDIVLPKYRTIIFVHGCFWHGHRGCKYYSIPKTNTDFWISKVARNQERDQEVWRQLEAKGWSVIIVWECELKKEAMEATVSRVQNEILKNGDALQKALIERRRAREEYRKRCQERKNREKKLLAEISHQ